MKDITYNNEILALIKDLSDSLIKEFVIRKIDDKLSIKVHEKSLSIYVDFNTPISNFDFDGEILGFSEGVYADFYKFFTLFKNPEFKQDVHKLILKENKHVIKFSPSDPGIIKNEFKGLKTLPDPVVSFSISREQFKQIAKMINMLDASEVKFIGSGMNLKIVIDNKVNENASSTSFPLEKDLPKEVNISLNTLIFKNAPELDYVINIVEDANLFHFKSVNEKFTLNLYTGIKTA